jgi:hypothetical protein
MMKKIGLAALAVTMLTPSFAMAATCYYVDFWKRQHEISETNLINRTIELEHNVSREGALTLEQLLGALKVVNRQKSGEESRKQEATKKADEAYVNTVNEQIRNERIVEIKEQYSYESGQGANACATVGFQQQVTSALSGYKSGGSAIYKTLDVAPGAVPDARSQAAARMDPSSTDASVLLANGSAAEKAKVIQQLAGFAVAKPLPAQSGTVDGEIQLIRSRQAEAWRSPALVSISTVSAMNQSNSLGIGDTAGSVFQAMDALIDNYGGGPAYAKWTNALQMQSERGLTVELNRLRALSMRLRTVVSESLARQAAVSASLLAAEATGK